MSKAREILEAARSEAKGQPRSLRTRQAAEKVWLATSTAADAMVGPVSNASQVFDAFKRAWGTEGEAIAKNIEIALHVGCFYGDAKACDGIFVEGQATALGKVFKQPIRDRQIKARLAKREH